MTDEEKSREFTRRVLPKLRAVDAQKLDPTAGLVARLNAIMEAGKVVYGEAEVMKAFKS